MLMTCVACCMFVGLAQDGVVALEEGQFDDPDSEEETP
jgi:hypothetical protein